MSTLDDTLMGLGAERVDQSPVDQELTQLGAERVEPKKTTTPEFEYNANPYDWMRYRDTNLSSLVQDTEQFKDALKESWKEWGAALKQGFASSNVGMLAHQAVPESSYHSVTEKRSFMQKVMEGGGQLADFPIMATGFLLGSVGGGGANPVTGGGGAMGLEYGLRKLLVDTYTKGKVKNAKEFAVRAAGALKETVKGEIIGQAGAVTHSKVAGLGFAGSKLVAIPTEAVAVTALDSLINGRIPSLEDFGVAASLAVTTALGSKYLKTGQDKAYDIAKNTVAETAERSALQKTIKNKLMEVYKETGEHPADVWEKAQNDSTIMEDLLSDNIPVPRALQNGPEYSAQGEKLINYNPKKEAKSVAQKVVETHREAVKTMIDDLNPLKTWVKDLAGGRKMYESLDAVNNPYKIFRLLRGIGGKMEHVFKYGLWDVKTNKINSRGFQEILKDVGDPKAFGNYLAYKRAAALHNEGIDTPFKGISDFDDVITSGDKNPKFQKAKGELETLLKSSLQYLKDSGVIDGDEMANLLNKSKDYVTFKKTKLPSKETSTSANQSVKDPVTKIKNNEAVVEGIENPLTETLRSVMLRVAIAEKNFANHSLVRFARQYDTDGTALREVEGAPVAEKPTLSEGEASQLKEALHITKKNKRPIGQAESAKDWVVEFTDKKGRTQRAIVVKDGSMTGSTVDVEYLTPEGVKGKKTLFRKDVEFVGKRKNTETEIPSPKLEDPVKKKAQALGLDPESLSGSNFAQVMGGRITVFEDGVRKTYEVSPDVADVVNGVGAEAAGGILKVAQVFANTLREGAVLSPDFAVRNPIRDAFSSMVFSLSKGANAPFKNFPLFKLPFVDFARGISEARNKGELFKLFLRSGASQAEMMSRDTAHFEKAVFDSLQSTPLRDTPRNPLELLRMMAQYSETGSRVGEFKSSMEGFSLTDRRASLESAYRTRDLMDFSKAGSFGRKVNRYIPFFNAALQGQAKMLEMLSDPKTAVQTVTKAIAYITLPSVALALATKDHPAIKRLPTWQRDLFWCIPTSSKEDCNVIRIPKPFELGLFFGSMFERAALSMTGDSKAWNHLGSTLTQGLPQVFPTIGLAPLENYVNYNFFTDSALMSTTLQKRLPEYQYTTYTTELAKKLSKAVGQLPGMDRIDSGYSPIEIENLVKGWSGNVGYYVLQMLDGAGRATGLLNDPVRAERTVADYPVVKAFFIRNPSLTAQPLVDFREHYNHYSKVMASMSGVQREMKYDDVAHLIGESQFSFLENVNSSISNIYMSIKLLNDLPSIKGMTSDELSKLKREMIDKMTLDAIRMAEKANDLYDNVEVMNKKLKDHK